MADLSTLLGMIDMQSISMVSAAIGILIGVFNWIRKSSTAERQRQTEIETRQAQLFMPLYDHLREIDFAKIVNEILFRWDWLDYEEFQSKYGQDSNMDNYSKSFSIGQYFEGIGVMVKRELINPYLVDDLISGFIIRYWEKMEPVIKIQRERMKWPQYMEHVEYLYNIIKPIVEEQHPDLKI
jgi:hypothetical protein